MSNNRYGVILKKSYSEEDSYNEGMYYSVYYNQLLEFTDEAELIVWIKNSSSNTLNNVVKYVKFNELKVSSTLTLKDA